MRLLQMARKLVYERKRYVFYRYHARQGAGAPSDAIRVCESYTDIPPQIRALVLPSRRTHVMYYRLQRGVARLLCHSEDGRSLQAYGWIQSWAPFRRKFAKLATDGLMLGPYWTAPEHRGRGLYGAMLSHSLSLCSKTGPILIYTSPENIASRRGIEKAGFEPLGEWVIAVWLRRFVCARKRNLTDRPAD